MGNSSCGLLGGGVGGEKGTEERVTENSSMAHRRIGCFSLRAKIPSAQGPSSPPGLVVLD